MRSTLLSTVAADRYFVSPFCTPVKGEGLYLGQSEGGGEEDRGEVVQPPAIPNRAEVGGTPLFNPQDGIADGEKLLVLLTRLYYYPIILLLFTAYTLCQTW